MARQDLVTRYTHVFPPHGMYASTQSVSGLLNQSMPMAAIFLRNKFVGWFALIQSIHYFLNTSEEEISLATAKEAQDKKNENPLEKYPVLKVALSFIGLCVCYLELVFPNATTTK
ncbi:uncharacterized protein KNAG_0H00700 [Huiozyma naganishii CBS 8797]|uniref:Uncharacterized protein n=1 Tax=Huiozyma naganishii (strain ATCC MYA-139 / BCRC 22969 / CBS 8797 / KCTC 17520 / NBRC 10181 / NCYC 3082 / Yp74L-3) TaxID=1071383 RepID=J7S9H0_HUIN7|nr:hypothetical protein KNAG_0H00700 [Kazachstania naganishii CBS 8797]CCK71486.1 hypothetical protein KNAG_0H00700 [Kazachstania naganishii CBS 8797]